MEQAHVHYEAQRFQQGYWIAAKEGTDRDSLIEWAHSRAVESEAPPMRVMEKTWANGSPVRSVIYRSWNPRDWPTNHRLRMWRAFVRMREEMKQGRERYSSREEREVMSSGREADYRVACRTRG